MFNVIRKLVSHPFLWNYLSYLTCSVSLVIVILYLSALFFCLLFDTEYLIILIFTVCSKNDFCKLSMVYFGYFWVINTLINQMKLQKNVPSRLWLWNFYSVKKKSFLHKIHGPYTSSLNLMIFEESEKIGQLWNIFHIWAESV